MARSINLNRGKVAVMEGIPELVDALNKIVSDTKGDALKKALMKAAMVCRDEARELAPVDTGTLKENIIATYGEPKGDKIDVIVMVRYGPGGANHAHLVEHGTSTAPAQPFMRPAVQITRPMMQQIIKEGVEKIVGGGQQMTLEEQLVAHLMASNPFKALVGTRLFPMMAPEGVQRPYMVYLVVVATSAHAHDGASSHESLVQFSIYSERYSDVCAIRDLLISLLDGVRGGFGVSLHAATRHLYESATKLHAAHVDFMVRA